jgi:hypothetical protein
MTIVTVVVAGLGLTWASDICTLGRWDRDLLGPTDERQRIEVPREGFAIAFPGGWDVDAMPAAEPDFVVRTALRPVLKADRPDQASSCTVYARSGDPPASKGCYPRAVDESWGVEAWDIADDVIAPLTSEYDCPSGFGIGALRSGGPVSLSFEEPSGKVLVAYHLTSDDSDFVLACSVSLPWPRGDKPDEPWPQDAFAVDWVLQPITETFESVPAAE